MGWLVLGALLGVLLVVQVGGEYEYYADEDGEEDVKDIQYYNYYNEVPAGGEDELVYFRITSPRSLPYVYKAIYAKDFGAVLERRYPAVHLVPSTPVDGCAAFTNPELMQGSIAFVARGVCSFAEKGSHAEKAGALAIMIYDNDDDNDHHFVEMVAEGESYEVHIPAMFVLGHDGWMITKEIHVAGLLSATIDLPLNGSRVQPHELSPGSPW